MSEAYAVQPPKDHAPSPVPTSVTAVSVKIPPFWSADPLVWLVQVKAQFETRDIMCQRTKFDHVIATLSNEFATEVCDIILSQLEVDTLSKLKDVLIKRTAALERKCLQLLFTRHLLRRMQQLPGDCWLPTRQLFPPGTIFPMVSQPCSHGAGFPSGDTVSLDNLANMADKMLEVAPRTVSSLASLAAPPTPPPSFPASSEVAQLWSDISELCQLISSLQLSNCYYPN